MKRYKQLPYKSDKVNKIQAKSMVSMSEKIVWAVLAVPITYLVINGPAELFQGDWVRTYIAVGGVMVGSAYVLKRRGLSILDEIEEKNSR